MAKGPVLIEIDEDDVSPNVADAPPVPDGPAPMPVPTGAAMQSAARIAARKPSRLGRLFWGIAGVLLTAALSTAAWDFAVGWIARAPMLGWALAGLMAALVLVLLGIAVRELAALHRLTRIDGLRHAAATALETDDLRAARAVTDRLVQLYHSRPELEWGRDRLA